MSDLWPKRKKKFYNDFISTMIGEPPFTIYKKHGFLVLSAKI